MRPRLALSAALALALVPTGVLAHAPVPGIEGFYTGLLHPLSTPAQVLVLLAVGLLAGSYPVRPAGVMLAVFFAGTLAGVFAGQAVAAVETLLVASALLAAGLAALGPGRLAVPAIVLACAGGVGIGIVSRPDPGPVRDVIFTASGALVGANLALVYLYGAVALVRDRYPSPWLPVALRVAAAWVAAVAVLMLAFLAAPDSLAP